MKEAPISKYSDSSMPIQEIWFANNIARMRLPSTNLPLS